MYFPGTPGYRSAWRETIEAADEANDPGRFTAFIGFEWTSNTGGNNLHRVCILRDNGLRASQVEPFTVYPPFGSDNPRELWKYLPRYEEKTGGDILAIAHNGNLSNGIMFPMVESFTGKPIDKEYAETRAKWEPLYEATQIKGDGETHPFLSPNDEFANFERWDKGNLDLSVLKKPEMLQFEYAREALKNGLFLEQQARHQPLQVRHDRLDRLAHRPGHGGRRQLLGQDVIIRAEPRSRVAPVHQDGQGHDHGLGADGLRLRRRVGDGEHARGDLRRDGAKGDLRHDRAAHDRAVLRRMGLRREGRAGSPARAHRVRQGRPDGR